MKNYTNRGIFEEYFRGHELKELLPRREGRREGGIVLEGPSGALAHKALEANVGGDIEAGRDGIERAAVGRGGICLVAEQLGLRDIARLIYRLGRRLRRDRLAAGGQRQGGGQSQAQGGAKMLSFHAVFSFVPIIGTSYRIPQLDYGTGPELCQAPAPYSLRRFRMNFTASSRRGSSAARLPLTETAATARPAASSTGQPMQ